MAARKKATTAWYEKKSVQWGAAIVFSIIILALIGFLVWALSDRADTSNQTLVATVNGQPIYQEEVSAAYARLPAELQQQYPPEDILEQLIDKELVLQEAADAGIEVSAADVEERIAAQTAQFGVTVEQLQELLAASNVSWEEYEDAVREEMILTAYVDQEILASITPDADDLEDYYEDNIAQYRCGEGEVRISHVLVDNQSLASSIAEEARAGEDFASLAQEHSIGPTGPSGGALGCISNQSNLVAPFKEAALLLEQGEVSAPVETQFGWHVIKRMPSELSLADVEDEVSQRAQESLARERFDDLLDELRDAAEIEYFAEPSAATLG